jgi:cold shock CspA family protein
MSLTLRSLNISCLTKSAICTRAFGTHTGIVKWYSRDKAYGFVILPDKREIYLSRNGIDTSLDFRKTPIRYPYLREGEKVTFDIDPRGKESAINIRFANGSKIPPVRKSWLGSIYRNNLERFSKGASAAMGDSTMGDDEKWAKVKEAYEMMTRGNNAALDVLKTLGLDAKDFPLFPDSNRNGVFHFEDPKTPTVKKKGNRKTEIENEQTDGESESTNDTNVGEEVALEEAEDESEVKTGEAEK